MLTSLSVTCAWCLRKSFVPLAARLGLKTELLAVLLKNALCGEALRALWGLSAGAGPRRGKVFDQQIDDVVCRGAHANVSVPGRRKQTDEVDEAEDASPQVVLLSLLVDQRLRLLEEQPCAVQVFVFLCIEEVGAAAVPTDLGATMRFASCTMRSWERAVAGAAGVGLAEHTFPEPTTHREQRVVFGEVLVVSGGVLDLAADKLPGNLPGDRRQRGVETGLLRGLLAEQHTADDGVDVLVLEDDLDGEAVLDLLERRVGRQLLLARCHE